MGALDLTAVEGLGDLIEAETENQRRQAVARADGGLARKIGGWRATLLDLRAEIEARLDFSDEGDVDATLPENVAHDIAALRDDMADANASFERGRVVRDGLRVAIAGPANAGKSSLLNALVKSDVAIVSDEPGTTRDVREVALDLAGHLVILVDMAGLRDADSKAEAEGVRRARAEIGRATSCSGWSRSMCPQCELPASVRPHRSGRINSKGRPVGHRCRRQRRSRRPLAPRLATAWTGSRRSLQIRWRRRTGDAEPRAGSRSN